MFAICVAGKNARVVQKQLQEFWGFLCEGIPPQDQPTPLTMLSRLSMCEIRVLLSSFGIGCHTVKGRALYELSRSRIDLRSCTPEQLETIHGIGPKTSRFFIMYTQPGARVAALDTHILRWLRDQGVDAPRQTPTGCKYRELEEEFIRRVPRGQSIAEFDLDLWLRYSRKVRV